MTFSKEVNPELDSTTKTVECSESSDEKSIDDEQEVELEVELEDLTTNGFGTIGGIGGIGSLGGSTSNFCLANMDAQWGFQSRGSIASEMDWMAEFGGEEDDEDDDDDDVFPLGDDSDLESDEDDNNDDTNTNTNNNPEALLGATMAALTISEDAEMTEENMSNSMSLNLTAPVAARQMIRRQSASRILLANKKKSTKNIDNMILPGSSSSSGSTAGAGLGSAERRAKIRASMLGFAGAMGDSMKRLEETAEEEEQQQDDGDDDKRKEAETKQSKTKSSSSKSSSSSKVRRHSYDSKRSNSSSSSSTTCKRAELMAKQRQVMSMRNFKTKNLGYRDLKSRENDSATRKSVIASSLEVHS